MGTFGVKYGSLCSAGVFVSPGVFSTVSVGGIFGSTAFGRAETAEIFCA